MTEIAFLNRFLGEQYDVGNQTQDRYRGAREHCRVDGAKLLERRVGEASDELEITGRRLLEQ